MAVHASARKLNVAIIGGGPVGIETALVLTNLSGFDVHLYEQGLAVGDAIRRWGHVRMFSPWSFNVSSLGVEALREQGFTLPPLIECPTGLEYIEAYLAKIASHPRLHERIHTGQRVISVGREGILKGDLIGDLKRREHRFRLLLQDTKTNKERVEYAHVVIDASGTNGQPNALGDGGIPALGERAASVCGLVSHDIPNPERLEGLIGKHVVVVGAGYSAITTINILQDIADIRITWITRAAQKSVYTRINQDPLPQRDKLAALGNALASRSSSKEELRVVHHLGGSLVEQLYTRPDGRLTIHLRNYQEGATTVLDSVDKVIANVGYHPDIDLHRELQVHYCYASEGPMKLASAMLSTRTSAKSDCLQQTNLGPETLQNPEPNFFILGAKSYGRGSTFLIRLGLEQLEDLKSLLV